MSISFDSNGITWPDLTGQLSGAKMGQTVIQYITARYSSSSTSYVAIGPTISITPTSSSSRILLMAYMSTQWGGYGYLSFLRTVGGSGTEITAAFTDSNKAGIMTYDAASSWGNTKMSFVDSPATTSTISYNIAIKTNGTTFSLNDNGSQNLTHFIATEILP